MIVVVKNLSRCFITAGFFYIQLLIRLRISFTFLKVNFQNIFLDNLFDLYYNNIQVVRLFLVYLYFFISALNPMAFTGSWLYLML